MNVVAATATPAQLTPVLGPFTVEISGIATPAPFPRLEDALRALWQSIRVLPLGYDQATALHLFLAEPGAAGNVLRLLGDPHRHGLVEATFAMSGVTHVVRIATAQRDARGMHG